ncbi:hypothetical protein COCOR_03085 [Corallococcus coralloides DSM 2259]|uniref:Uncharacterized protein n=1 Tax=Corallococcus coralloides (strain ATCC 25202 / DSM 2259 / NBRC 100086 / M2) TaxID=1144275 RepID=H8N1R2_CORCM|nr:hypothetical protein [Corallococcus coralloides]AFE04995.1 hypothetical protein COCOR_03085 [Corallococcus coralloides DSM 2259]
MFDLSVLQDESLRIPLLIIVSLTLVSLGSVAWRRKRLAQAVQDVEVHLEDLLAGRREEPGTRDEGRALWRAVREQLVFPPGKQEVPGPILMRSSPSRELRETCRALFRHSMGHGIGRNLTGIALVMTFGLLGVVLVGPVQAALTSTGAGGASQADLLSQAIGKMGAKFFISAAGLLGTLFFQAFAFSSERRLLMRLDAMRASFERITLTLDAHEISLAAARRDALGALKTEIVQTRRDLSDRLSHLESVEVSLQDIGTEVQKNFGTMMKEQVGDVITRQLGSVEKAVRDIAADLQRSISMGFTAALQLEMAGVRAHLDAIQQALAGQQEHDLGRILEQLRDTVSGGFHTQSQDMARQMAGLVEVLPRLEQQFEVMTQTLGSHARQWGSENQRAVEALGEKVSELVGSFDGVRDRLEGSGSNIASSFKDVLTGLRESSSEMVRLAAQASLNMQSNSVQQSGVLRNQMEELRVRSESDMGQFQAQSQEFVKVMRETQDGLRTVTKQMSDTADKLAAASRGVGESHHKAGAVSAKMDEVAQRLMDTANAFQRLSQERSNVVRQEQTLLNAQREAVDRVGPVLNALTKTYEDSVSRQAQILSSQWTEVMHRLDSVVDRSSGELVQGVDDLTETVQQLKETLRQQVARR